MADGGPVSLVASPTKFRATIGFTLDYLCGTHEDVMQSDELLDELETVLAYDGPLRVVVEVHGQVYDIQEVGIEWHAVPTNRLLVIKTRSSYKDLYGIPLVSDPRR